MDWSEDETYPVFKSTLEHLQQKGYFFVMGLFFFMGLYQFVLLLIPTA